jgi:hypothetical protein
VREDRRSILKKGLLGGLILAVGGAIPIAMRRGAEPRAPRGPLRVFTPIEHEIFASAAARLVPGDGAGADWPTADALDCAGKVDGLLARLHPSAGVEFRRLLRLFENAMTGLLVLGHPTTFTRSSPADQDRRLEAWRHARTPLLRSGYQAMKRLAHATYYASPETFARVGYPGPPVVPQPPKPI